MPLLPGARVGPYTVVSSLGAGGMGEVYRARDPRLERDVAIKILPATFAEDPDRLARFEREAKALAALNHPNIAHLHGLEEAPSAGAGQAAGRALVMELVDGEDLADRLQRGALPADEALAVTRQIAEGLEAAHERGIIHRDLKPANIKVIADGTVKILDFGLAKALDPDTSGSVSAMNSPTFTSPMTQMGVILGTAAYMAPEQAKGKPVDRRADIWALGAVLFEMLSGRRVFEGETATETIAQIITQAPDFELLPASTPPAVRRILRRCLEKDPRRRFQAAGDVRLEIDEHLDAPAPSPAPGAARGSHGRAVWPWVVAALFGAMSAVAIWKASSQPPPGSGAMRLEVRVGTGELAADDNVDGALAILSPDGRTLVYAGNEGPIRRLYVRPLDTLEGKPIGGTEGAMGHFFSPDGRWIGFFADRKLKKVTLSGGAPVPIADAPDARGGAWGDDDRIVFAPTTTSGLGMVPAAGGTPVSITTIAEGERSHRWPTLLPGAKAVLFIRQDQNSGYDEGYIEAVRLDTNERKVILRGGTYPRYLHSGHIAYVRESTVFVVPFDASRLEVRGEARPALTGVTTSGGHGAGLGNGSAQIDFSANGTAVYLAGASAATLSRLAILDRTGRRLYTSPDKQEFRDPRFSPDASQIAYSMGLEGTQHIFIHDTVRSTTRRLTFDGTLNALPVWSPDGTRIAYFSDRAGRGLNVFITPADGSGRPEALTTGDGTLLPTSFSPDGKLLALMQQSGTGALNAAVLTIATKEIRPFTEGDTMVIMPMFSPDGRWIAYSTGSRSGPPEVVVRSYPVPGGHWQISSSGGGLAVWSKGGRELVYLAGADANQLMVSEIDTTPNAITAGPPVRLLDVPLARPSNAGWFDVSADGSRIAALLSDETLPQRGVVHVTFVFNFFEQLR